VSTTDAPGIRAELVSVRLPERVAAGPVSVTGGDQTQLHQLAAVGCWAMTPPPPAAPTPATSILAVDQVPTAALDRFTIDVLGLTQVVSGRRVDMPDCARNEAPGTTRS